MGHRAGFINYLGGDYEVISKEEAIKRLFSADLVVSPGTEFRYSNGGYSLLAVLIEKITGEAYEDYVVREILKPMGMDMTGYVQGGWETGDLAVGYHRNGDRWGHSMEKEWADDGPSWTLRGNGGMLTHISDLRKMITYFEKEQGDDLQQKFRSILIPGGIIGTAGGNDISNVDIEWDIRKKSGVIIFSSVQNYKGEALILDVKEGKRILREIME